MTCMGACKSSKYSLIGPLTAELAALERLKKSPITNNGKNGLAVLDRIHFILAGNDDIHESLDEFEIWPDPTTGFHGTDRVIMEKNGVATFSRLFFYPILFILAGYDDMHERSEEFEIRPDPTTDCGVSCP